ncbi:5-oxoprolinase subunit PxpA [Pseudoxanthomonas sacheonensis]|uniref:5-oxoprolinase subunit PxpA n=1 Tax=Pseudoxanthomonas sacheonensis TaxID=443615 RepID=UPI0013CF6501|nr:5-oxoprolinase subunit PxpA [Pseudoxanthomonas sacheonensis]KAF1707310.1 lactam utilization protein LamB [Pseudoxanthomonas sacheonensis]
MRPGIDFNCDLGEGVGDDASILPFISSASIACGFHAGSPELMRKTVNLCGEHGVAIGAHPSFADRENFGRTAQSISPGDAYALTLYQIGALDAFVRAAGLRLNHVKPHGAFYNQAARDRELADAVASAVRDHDPGLILFGLAGSVLTDAGTALGLQVVHEAFAERRYEADATLTPRNRADASIEHSAQAAMQVIALLRDGAITARTGELIPLRADSICLHGDRPDAARFARELRTAIENAGFEVRAPERLR